MWKWTVRVKLKDLFIHPWEGGKREVYCFSDTDLNRLSKTSHSIYRDFTFVWPTVYLLMHSPRLPLVAIISRWIPTSSHPTVTKPSVIRFSKILQSSLMFRTWPTWPLPIGFVNYNLYTFLISPMRVTCLAHLTQPSSVNKQNSVLVIYLMLVFKVKRSS